MIMKRVLARAITQSGINREEVFWSVRSGTADQGYESTLKAFNDSLERLNLDYLDLYLIHWPVEGKYKDTWRALEHLYEKRRYVPLV